LKAVRETTNKVSLLPIDAIFLVFLSCRRQNILNFWSVPTIVVQICNVDIYSILHHILLKRTQDLGQVKSGVAKSNPSQVLNIHEMPLFLKLIFLLALVTEFRHGVDFLVKCRVNGNT
jgi:hypothetical protein